MYIEKLPGDLERQLPEISEEWTRIGLSTEPPNRELAEKGVDLAYIAMGLEPPAIKIWLRSPLEGLTAAAFFETTEQTGNRVLFPLEDDITWEFVTSDVRSQVERQVTSAVLKKIKQVHNDIKFFIRWRWSPPDWDNVYSQINAPLNMQGWGQIKDKVLQQVTSPEGTLLEESYGQHDAHQLAYYKVFHNLNKDMQRYEGLWLIAQNCGRCWPFEKIAVLTERPNKMQMNESGKLHCSDGPALEFSDGLKIYYWNGIDLPVSWIITDKARLNPDTIKAEPAPKLRQLMQEIYDDHLSQQK